MVTLKLFLCACLTAWTAAFHALAGLPAQQRVPALDGNPIAEADRAFCRAVAAKDLKAFGDLIAEDAVFHGRAGRIHGRAAIVKAWSGFFDPKGKTTLTWEPDRAEIAASGDLGYTLGASVFKGVDKDGRPAERRGRYVTIWRKTAGSPWQVVVDIGSDDEPVKQ